MSKKSKKIITVTSTVSLSEALDHTRYARACIAQIAVKTSMTHTTLTRRALPTSLFLRS